MSSLPRNPPCLAYRLPLRPAERYDLSALQAAALTFSRRQAAILAWITNGSSNKEIAAVIGVGMKTVEAEVTHILRRLGVSTRLDAAVIWALLINADRPDGIGDGAIRERRGSQERAQPPFLGGHPVDGNQTKSEPAT